MLADPEELESSVLSKNSAALPCDALFTFLNWSEMIDNSTQNSRSIP